MMNPVHIHLLLNHSPIIGTIIALGIFVVSLIGNRDELKQASLALFTLIALVAIPAFMSGYAAQNAMKDNPDVSMAMIQTHQGAALLAFISMEITGIVSLLGLWRFSRTVKNPWMTRPARATLVAVLVVVDYSMWVWPILEDLHFLGLILLLGTTGALNLRILGFLKQLPVAPFHRFIPWGIAGLVVNIITGFLFFMGMPGFYVPNIVFQIKMLAIILAGGNLLLFYCTSAFRRLEGLGPGEDAPRFAKFIAVS